MQQYIFYKNVLASVCAGRERVKGEKVYVSVQRCWASGELQCPSLGRSISPQVMGAGKGPTLLSSTTFCSSSYLASSFSQLLFYLLLEFFTWLS